MVAIQEMDNQNKSLSGLVEAAKAPEATTRQVPWYMYSPEDRYTMQRVLGCGHYANVYLATSKESGEMCAIKVLDKAHPEYNEADVLNEVNILQRVCDHPNIASLREVFEDPAHVYLVEEPCMGGELFDLVIERKHFSEGDAARAAAVLVSVVSHCHTHGVLHRDIKPENFLLAAVPEEGRFDGSQLRAVDFGLSTFNKSPKDVVGSSYYIAPEVLAGQPYGPPADAWSLGVVVFILISGHPPFFGRTDDVLYDRIQHQELDMEYEPWITGEVSPAAANFVKRLLTKDPAQRMTCTEAAAHPWLTETAFASDDVPLAPAIVERLRAFTRQNRLTCLLMTLVAHHMSDDAIGELRRTFEALDTDNDGLISVSDITRALEIIGVNTAAQGIPDLATGLDEFHDHAGTVHVDEFLAAALDKKKVLTRNTVAAVFNRLDVDHSGMLSMASLSEALAECGVLVPEARLRGMMAREGALEGAGVVSAKSFQSLLMSGAEPQVGTVALLQHSVSNGSSQLDGWGGSDAGLEEYHGQDWQGVVAPLSPKLEVSIAPRRTSLDCGNTVTPPAQSPTGRTLDDILRHYSCSGWRTPIRKGSLRSQASPLARVSKASTPQATTPVSSLSSPSMACLGYD